MADDATASAVHATHMGEALREAEVALAASEVPVGCVYVHPERGVVMRGHNRTVASCNNTRHQKLFVQDSANAFALEASHVQLSIGGVGLAADLEHMATWSHTDAIRLAMA